MNESSTTFTINGELVTVAGGADRPLLDVLRDDLGLKSVRASCGIGICGTCTVLLDGRVVSGCLLLLGMVEGQKIETTEGTELDRFQEAFADAGAYQCSFCIPAMVLTTWSIAEHDGAVSPDEAAEQLAGNLCRCGSYPQIRQALSRLFGHDGPTT